MMERERENRTSKKIINFDASFVSRSLIFLTLVRMNDLIFAVVVVR